MKQYKQLCTEERFYIWQALREGKSAAQVAIALDRDPSTISREIKRNSPVQAKIYTYYWAVLLCKYRKQRANKMKYKKMTTETERLVELLIRQYLSPEQVSGYLKEHHSISLSHETIYRFIYRCAERKKALKPYLRQGKKIRRKRYGSGARAALIPNRISIDERPGIVNKKSRIGDWECDTVVGQDRRSVLVTLVDRATLYTCVSRVYSRTASVVASAIIRLLRPFKDRVETLTFDNGTEFVRHEKIARALDAKTYFAHPYSSWERGINENTNGLLRQFFPKKTDFSSISWKQVKDAVDNLNNRPRKTRSYQTPNQLFNNIFVPLL